MYIIEGTQTVQCTKKDAEALNIQQTNEGTNVITLNKMQLLDQFFSQRSGMDWRDYYQSWRDSDGVRAYRSDRYNHLTRPRQVYNILQYIAGFIGVTDQDLADAAPHHFSGRLAFTDKGIEYTTGQYFPTEYRHAVNAVLLGAIRRAYMRDLEAYGGEYSHKDYKAMLKRHGITRGMLSDYGLA